MNDMMRYLAGLSLMLAALCASAHNLTEGQEKSDYVLNSIRSGDCGDAVRRLNEGLVKAYPEIFMLAGSMFDNGICVKPDWKKAVHFYVRANDAGQQLAAYRLAAGFASPEHGQDVAAALWWATRPQVGMNMGSCSVSDAAKNDPDKFVAELSKVPPATLAMCNYVVGVMTTLSAEIRYPDKAATYHMGGNFTLRFLPAVPRIDIKKAETTEYAPLGVESGDALRDRDSRRISGSFEEELTHVAQRALKRYPKPANIDPKSSVEMNYTFFQTLD